MSFKMGSQNPFSSTLELEMKTGYPGVKEFFLQATCLCWQICFKQKLLQAGSLKLKQWEMWHNWTGEKTLHSSCSAPVEHDLLSSAAGIYKDEYLREYLGLFVWANVTNSFVYLLSLSQTLWDQPLREFFPVKFCDGESLGNLAGTGGDSSLLPSAGLPEYLCLTLLWCTRLGFFVY